MLLTQLLSQVLHSTQAATTSFLAALIQLSRYGTCEKVTCYTHFTATVRGCAQLVFHLTAAFLRLQVEVQPRALRQALMNLALWFGSQISIFFLTRVHNLWMQLLMHLRQLQQLQ
jgi:hypothetical protein